MKYSPRSGVLLSDTVSSDSKIKPSVFCVGLIYLSLSTVLGTHEGHDVSSLPLNCSSTRRLIITSQTQLNSFILSSSSNEIRVCYCLILTGGDYQLDLPQLMKVNLGANGSLVI